MNRSVFLGIAAGFLLCISSVSAYGQILLNEIDVNPGGGDNGCEYIELIGPPGAAVENLHFVSLEGDTNKGQATAVISFGVPGPVIGSNGLLVVVSAAGCAPRTYAAGTTVITTTFLDNPTGVLQNGSNSFVLISSTTAIAPNADLDANDDGVLELPVGAVIIDSVSWTDGGATDVVYGAQLIASGTVIGAATRFAGDTRANNSRAWYAGTRVGAASEPTYSDTVRTANFPAGGALTPGAPNIGNAVRDAPVDMNGDGKTDYVVARAAGGAGSQLTAINGGNPTHSREWGVSGDKLLAGDYDGDGIDDVSVYRPSTSTFYIIQSATLTMRIEQFGQTGDDPGIVGDYNGDGRDDIAVWRAGAQAVWFFKTSPAANFQQVLWGEGADRPAPGDYDGDGKADFVVVRPAGFGLSIEFWKQLSTGTFSTERVLVSGDLTVVPGDYDDDGKTDMAVVRHAGGIHEWHFEPSGTPGNTLISDTWGVAGDKIVQGDYDGDGRTDYAVWRPGDPGTFYVMTVGERAIFTRQWGQTNDLPVAGFNNR